MWVLLVLLGCGTARRDLPPATSAQAAVGEAEFFAHCHACHPHGAAGLGPAINNKPLPRFLMRTQVRAGLGAMPSFDEEAINDAELDALVAYLVALRRDGG